LSTYFNITVIAEWLALLASIFLLTKRRGIWQLLIPLLFLTVCAETIGWHLKYHLHSTNNSSPFNILLIITIPVYACILISAEPLRESARNIRALTLVFITGALYNLFLGQGFCLYNSYTEVGGDILISSICCYFMLRLLAEQKNRDLLSYEYFWLANGLLFSCLGSILLYLFLDELLAYHQNGGANVYGIINYTLNVILYASMILAFLCRYRTTRSLQQ
jgi:hypothetical protein